MQDTVRFIALAVTVLGLATALVAGGLGTAGAASQEAECSYPFTSTDATGSDVVVEEPPETVVTLGPSAAQTMWEIGAQEKVIGVSKYASYLDGASDKANVSGAGQSMVVVEKVVDQDPDLVLAPNIIQNDTVSKLRESGLTVYRFEAGTSMDDVVEKTRLFGGLTGECEAANDRSAEMDDTLSTVEQAVEGEERPRVLYVFGGYTAGEGTFIDSIITTAGGTNVAAEAGISSFQQISPEVVTAQDPEWIIVNTDFPSVPSSDAYNSTTAVQEDNIIVLDANYISQPAPRTTQVVTKLVETWHPEAYESALEASQTTTTTTTSTPEDTTTDTTTESESDTTTEGESDTTTTTEPTETTATESPGIGIAGALLAMILTMIAFRRR